MRSPPSPDAADAASSNAPEESAAAATGAQRRALVLVNRQSRSGDLDTAPALAILREGGIEPFLPDEAALRDDPAGSVAKYGSSCDLLVFGGGDGTLNRLIDAALAVRRPIGILPLGTANDLARTLGLPTDLLECAKVIVNGRTRRIDLGRANDKHFFNVASLGLSTIVARELDSAIKARFGVLGYAFCLGRAVIRRQVIKATITIDSKTIRARAIQISVGNGRYYGGGMAIAEDAQIDDGLLDLVVVEPQTLPRLLGRLPIFRRGRHDLNDNVHHFKAERIEVSTGLSLSINTDGEVTTRTPVRFEIVPKAIEIFTP